MNFNNKTLLFLLFLIISCCAFNVVASDILEQAAENTAIKENVDSGTEDENIPDIVNTPDETEENSEMENYEVELQSTSHQQQEETDSQNNTIPEETPENIPENIPENTEPEVTNMESNFINIENLQQAASEAELRAETIDSESIVVYSFDELKSALSGNNGYNNVYLGANIDMKALGIEIHTSKKRVMISGINPLNGLGPFTINEYNSLDPGYTIRVVSNLGAKEVVMKDINVTGRNYYGALCVYDGVTDVLVTFDNITYNGPQISYNRGGTVRITGDSQIQITGSNGLSDAQELAEAAGLELGGNTVINHYAPVMSGIWLVGSNSYIKVLSGARVTWNETGTYMIFQDNANPVELTLEKDARLTINTINGLFYNASALLHQFGNVLIDIGANLEIRQQGTSTIPVIKVKKGIQVQKDASLIILAQSAPQLLYMTGAADFTADYPSTLALYNKTNKLIEWSDTQSHKISILSSFINYWSTPCELDVLGNFTDSPLRRWRKKNGADLSVEITASSSATTSVASNYTQEDYGDAPNETSLNIQGARVITAGKMPLFLDAVTNISIYISGQTQPMAQLCAYYTDVNGVERTVYGNSDSGGAFDIKLEEEHTPQVGSTVTVYSSSGYKNVIETTVVIEEAENSLAFMHVPSHLIFPATSITAKKELVERADDNWHIIVGDTRSQGSKWELQIRLKEPLTGYYNDLDYIVEDAVIFKDVEGSLVTLDDTPHIAARGVKAGEAETVVQWPKDRGIMLYADTLKVYTGVSYRAKIEWTLADVP